MGKRFLISLIAIMSLGAIWWTDAGAGPTCLAYGTVSGSSTCLLWRTGTVVVEVTFRGEECFVADPYSETGSDAVCSATAQALTNDSIAFCGNPLNPTPVTCNATTFFTGSASPGECEAKHDQDVTGEGGLGHEHHGGCTAEIPLVPDLVGCQTCCDEAPGGPKGACVDVTPVEMMTRVTGFVGSSSEPPAVFTIGEHCTINPKKIRYHEERPYQCSLECVDEGCPPLLPPPPPPCDPCIN